MNLINEINEFFRNTLGDSPFKVTMFGSNAIYIEGAKTIKYYTKQEIFIILKNGGIKIIGEDLFIKKYCLGDVAICGKIQQIIKE